MEEKKSSKFWGRFFKIVGMLTIVAVILACCSISTLWGVGVLTGNRLSVAVVNPSSQTAPFGGVIADDTHDGTVPAEASTFSMPDGAMALLRSDMTPKGYFLILYKPGPAYVSVPEGGFTIVACGNCTVGGKRFVSDGTQGNLIVLMGTNADGTTPADLNTTVVIDDYTTGHVAVTTIWSVNDEDPVAAAMAAITGMFEAPNCGQEGCLSVDYFVWWPGMEAPSGETFTTPPAVP